MKSAEGLEAGKTTIHYNGVDIGTVTKIELSPDHQHAILTAQTAPRPKPRIAVLRKLAIQDRRWQSLLPTILYTS